MRTPTPLILLSALLAFPFSIALYGTEVSRVNESADETGVAIEKILQGVKNETEENQTAQLLAETDYRTYKIKHATLTSGRRAFNAVTTTGAFLSIAKFLHPYVEFYYPAAMEKLSTLPAIPYSDHPAFFPAVTATVALTVGALKLYRELHEEDILNPTIKDAISRLGLPKKIRLELTTKIAEILYDYRVITQENNELLKKELARTANVVDALEQELTTIPKATNGSFASMQDRNTFEQKLTEIDHNLDVVGNQLTAIPKIIVALSQHQAEALKAPKRAQKSMTNLAKLFS